MKYLEYILVILIIATAVWAVFLAVDFWRYVAAVMLVANLGAALVAEVEKLERGMRESERFHQEMKDSSGKWGL